MNLKILEYNIECSTNVESQFILFSLKRLGVGFFIES